MTIYKFSNLTLPPTLEKRREALEAFHTLVDQDDELIRQRRAEIAAIRREMEDIRRCIDAICRQMPELRKYGYNPEEPRVPKRQTGGGEWTQIAASDNPGEASDAPIPYQKSGRGHHWVTVKIFTKRPFSNEVKAFFDNARSGPLADPKANYNTKEHRAYNDAVNDLLDEFLKKNNITEEQMTLAQAEEFVQEVKTSTNPVIREFVMKINREVLRYGLRLGPWRRGGGGGDE